MNNDFNYKWSKIFASKRYNTKDGVIKLAPEEQQELLDDSKKVKSNSVLGDVRDSSFNPVGLPPKKSGDYIGLFSSGDECLINYDKDVNSWHNGTNDCSPTHWKDSL